MIYLGIDSGTQSTKTIALDFATGEILASAQKSYELIHGLPPGHLEQHPRDWIAAVEQTIAACLEQLGERKNEVRGIGVSGQQHGLVVLDENDEVIRPAKLWCDTSTVAECEAFANQFGDTAGLVELAGNAILPGFTAPKILWLKNHEPENFARVRTVLLPHDYLNFWLTGEKRMEYGDASGTGLLNVHNREWSLPLCDFIEHDFARHLPPLGSSSECVGRLRESLREAWGLSESPVVSAGGGDNMMSAIGTGNIAEGVFTVSLGTSGTVFAFSKRPITDPLGEIAAFCDSTDHWLPLVCTMNVTVATEQTRRLFDWTIDAFNEAVATAPAGAGGLLFLPYLTGERTPSLPGGTGVFHGLTLETMTAPYISRAVMEGVTLGIAYGMERFRSLGMQPSEIRLTGGGSKSAVWRQIVADIFDVPTVCLQTAEGAALGGAIQVAWSENGGGTEELQAMVGRLVKLDESTRAMPNPANRDIYKRAMQRVIDLTANLHVAGYL